MPATQTQNSPDPTARVSSNELDDRFPVLGKGPPSLVFWDSGSTPQVFAAVEIVRTQSSIVPVDKLQVIATSALGKVVCVPF